MKMSIRKWLVASVATAVAIAFVGCGGGTGDPRPDPEPTPPPSEYGYDVLFDLREFLADKPLGLVTETIPPLGATPGVNDLFPRLEGDPNHFLVPLAFAGSPVVQIIDVGGYRALMINPTYDWNGLDLVHQPAPGASGREYFDFRFGDVIELAGVDSHDGGTRNQVVISRGTTAHGLSGFAPIGDWHSQQQYVGGFSNEFVLSQADVDGIVYLGGPDANRFTGMRIRGNEAHAFVITELVVRRPRTAPPIPVVSDFAIPLAAPVAGFVAPATVANPQLTGAVTWYPAIAANEAGEYRFAILTPYTATIVITAREGFTLEGLPAETEFTITGATVTFNQETSTITAAFQATGGEILQDIEAGDGDAALNAQFTAATGATNVFSLATWLGANTAIGAPLADAGSTPTIVGSGINVARAEASDWRGLDVRTRAGADNLAMNNLNNVYRVTVFGFVLGTPTPANMEMRLGPSGAPWGDLAESGELSGDYPYFKLAGEIPAAWTASQNIRINSTNSANNFRVSLIEIERLGPRAPCACDGCDLYGIPVADIDGEWCTCVDCDDCEICAVIGPEPQPLPPNDTSVSYVVPTYTGANGFYLNLNTFHDHPMLVAAPGRGRPRVVTAAGNVTYTFYAEEQAVAITLTPEQRTALQGATAMSIVVDASFSVPTTQDARILFGNAALASGWGGSGVIAWGPAAGLVATHNVTSGAGSNADHLIIQLRGATAGVPITMVINSIRISYTPGGPVSTLFQLTTNVAIQAMDTGTSGQPAGIAGVPGIVNAGGTNWAIVDNAGVNAIQLELTDNWNGLDLQNSHFNFAEGDIITVTVVPRTITAANAQLILSGYDGNAWNSRIGSQPGIGTVGTAVNWGPHPLTAAEITAMGSGRIRIGINNATAGDVLEIQEIVVERPVGGGS